jgi:hypothetical protein
VSGECLVKCPKMTGPKIARMGAAMISSGMVEPPK